MSLLLALLLACRSEAPRPSPGEILDRYQAPSLLDGLQGTWKLQPSASEKQAWAASGSEAVTAAAQEIEATRLTVAGTQLTVQRPAGTWTATVLVDGTGKEQARDVLGLAVTRDDGTQDRLDVVFAALDTIELRRRGRDERTTWTRGEAP